MAMGSAEATAALIGKSISVPNVGFFFGTQTHSKVYRHKVSNGVRRKETYLHFDPSGLVFSKL